MDNTLDTFNLRQVILDSVKQTQFNYTIENQSPLSQKSFSRIVICGMGGSALPAELLSATFSQFGVDITQYPIYIHRSYKESPYIDENTLVLAISYSGNTEETVSAYEDTLAKGRTVIALAADGVLINKAKEQGNPYVVIPNPDPYFQPRYATLYILKAILQVLIAYDIIDESNQDILTTLLQGVNPQEFEEQGQQLAQSIKGKTPIVYATEPYKVVAHLWKIKINENAKTPCFWNYVPELNHNEMVGFTNPQADFQFIFIHNASETSRNILRFEKLNTLFTSRGLSVIDIIVPDYGNHLANIIAMILIGDWTAYYLALAYGIDPTPVDMVEEFKVLMKN